MDCRRLIGRLLAVFVIVGLVAAPLVTPAAAKRLAVAEMTDMSMSAKSMSAKSMSDTSMSDTSAMSADMPCCPDEQKTNNCRDCPLVAMCMLTIAQAEPPSTSGIQAPLQTGQVIFALDDLIADGLIGAPPDHPPRTLI